jgi:hypothetical protein
MHCSRREVNKRRNKVDFFKGTVSQYFDNVCIVNHSLFFLLFFKFRQILYSAFPDTNRSLVTILNDMSARLKIWAELIHEKILKSKFYGTIPLRSLNYKKNKSLGSLRLCEIGLRLRDI